MNSKLKLSSTILIISLNIPFWLFFWFLFTVDKNGILSLDFWQNQYTPLFILIGSLGAFCLYQLLRLKRITIKNGFIIFSHPIVPFFKKKRAFSYYDYSKTIIERSRYNEYESLWLIKDGRFEDEISSFIFSNYVELKREIKVKNKGRLKITPLKQMTCRFGNKI